MQNVMCVPVELRPVFSAILQLHKIGLGEYLQNNLVESQGLQCKISTVGNMAMVETF